MKAKTPSSELVGDALGAIAAKTTSALVQDALGGMAPATQEGTETIPSPARSREFGEKMLSLGYRAYDKEAFAGLARWAAGDRRKGLLLAGPVGVGKTAFFRMCVLCTIRTAKEIQENANGCRVDLEDAFTVVVDDWGKEPTSVEYGQREEILSGFFCKRHVQWERDGLLTHITLNLEEGEQWDSKKRVKRYGVHVFDRVRQMCKIVKFKPGSHRGTGQ